MRQKFINSDIFEMVQAQLFYIYIYLYIFIILWKIKFRVMYTAHYQQGTFELNSADVAFRPEPYPVDRQLGEGTNSLREHSYLYVCLHIKRKVLLQQETEVLRNYRYDNCIKIKHCNVHEVKPRLNVELSMGRTKLSEWDYVPRKPRKGRRTRMTREISDARNRGHAHALSPSSRSMPPIFFAP